MNFNSDFLIRLLGPYGPLINDDKHDVNDGMLESVVCKIGGSQMFLDISRCPNLKPPTISKISMCSSLLYLDISYTKAANIGSICENCSSLKSLNLSGLDIINFGCIHQLYSLEVLLLRKSNIVDLDPINNLGCLRSLDLGHTGIQSITSLQGLTRLEELRLDYSLARDDGEWNARVADTFLNLPKLSLLNIQCSTYTSFESDILNLFGQCLYLEKRSRKQMYFDAVINNESERVYEFLCHGQEINMRANADDAEFLCQVWQSRCTTLKIKLPFFQCHEGVFEELRPSAMCLAIYFNAYETLQVLLDHGADRTVQVWFGDVMEERGILVENSGPLPINKSIAPQLAGKVVVSMKELAQLAFYRNVHRLTEHLLERKVANWKSVCDTYMKRLLFLLSTTKASQRIKVEELEKRKSFAMPEDEVEAEEASHVAQHVSGGVSVGSLDSLDIENAVERMTTLTMGAMVTQARARGLSFAADSGGSGGPGSPSGRSVSPLGGSMMSPMSPLRKSMSKNVSFSANAAASPVPQKKGILPPKQRRYPWRTHVLVKKLEGKPEIYTVKVPGAMMESTTSTASMESTSKRSTAAAAPNSNNQLLFEKFHLKELQVMGHKSFWLESRAHVAVENAVVYESEAFRLFMKRKNSNVYMEAMGEEDEMVTGKKDKRKEEPRASSPERRKRFVQEVKGRAEERRANED